MSKRVGIFSGVFDPVHNGHVDFALQAIKQASLDEVYFLVEAKPRRKTDVTHLAHRIAMIKLVISSYANLRILDLPDKQFSVAKTLPRLRQQFGDARLVLLAGSDMLKHIDSWPLVNQMFKQMGLVIGLRQGHSRREAEELIKKLPVNPHELVIFNSPKPKLSSQTARQNLAKNQQTADLDQQVVSYIKANWLYVAPSDASSAA